jgi:hypothetical protein
MMRPLTYAAQRGHDPPAGVVVKSHDAGGSKLQNSPSWTRANDDFRLVDGDLELLK